jgi:predicted phosphoribosyltransferase
MFRNRRDAGRQLATHLRGLGLHDPVVLGLPRGGVPVAAEVATALGTPLDVLVVRKIGCPWHPELGVGAIGEDGVRILNDALIAELRLSRQELEAVTAREQLELERRVRRYRAGRSPADLRGRTVIVIDDGIATGFTARAAVTVARRRGAARVVLAVPVGSTSAIHELGELADDIVCQHISDAFWAIGQFYADFTQTSDDEVAACLAEAATAAERPPPDDPPADVAGSGRNAYEQGQAAADRIRQQELADLRHVPLGNALFTRDSFEAEYGPPVLVGPSVPIDPARLDPAWRCIYCDGDRLTAETYATDLPDVTVRFWWCEGCGLGHAVSWGATGGAPPQDENRAFAEIRANRSRPSG